MIIGCQLAILTYINVKKDIAKNSQIQGPERGREWSR
jgi:hypothetical protein